MTTKILIDKFAISLIEQRADEVLDENILDEIISFTQVNTNEDFVFDSLFIECRYHYTLGNLHSAIYEKKDMSGIQSH